MKTLIRFLVQFRLVFLLFLFQAISITLIINSYNDKYVRYLNASNAISGSLFDKSTVITEYFSLRETNRILAEENARFQNLLKTSFKSNYVSISQIRDSVYSQQYFHYSAKIISSSTHKMHNYITLNKGRMQGVTNNMAVVGPNGVVGIIKSVSADFSTAITLLNTNYRMSGRVLGKGYLGNIVWKGNDYRYVEMQDIPLHVPIELGDTVVSSGFSTLFPEGVIIGQVVNSQPSQNEVFHNITLALATDFKRLTYVSIVGNLLKEELIELENETEND